MTKQETAKLISLITLAFPQAEIAKNSEKLEATVLLWQTSLNDIPYVLAERAILDLIKVSKFPPSIAEIREKADEIKFHCETAVSWFALELRNYLDSQIEFFDEDLEKIIDTVGGIENLITIRGTTRFIDTDKIERIYKNMYLNKLNNKLIEGK